MSGGNNPEKNRSKSLQTGTKRRLTSEDNRTSNNCPVTSERSDSEANTTASAASRPADQRRPSSTIRTPLILSARVSKSNWFEPCRTNKVDLLQYISQPGLTSSAISRRKDVKTMHGDSEEKQNNSSVKTVASSQGSKRKITNGNDPSPPTSKRMLRSVKENSTKRKQKESDKPQTTSSLLNRSRSTTKTTVKKENATTSKSSLKTKEKQNNSSVKTIVSLQGNKRKITNANNPSPPTSKRILRSAKENSTKRKQKESDKPQTTSSLLNRSRSTTKTTVKKENATTSKSSLKTKEKQNNSSVKTIVSLQGNKRKITNANNPSPPTSKRILRSAKENSTKRKQKESDKPQTTSSLLNRSRSTTKTTVKKENATASKSSLKTNKIRISNVPINQDTIRTCSNRQRSQSKKSSKTKSARKSKKRRKSSESSTNRSRQSRTSAPKRKKSKKTSAKPRKSNKASKSRAQSKERKSTKSKVGPRNSQIKRIETRSGIIATNRASKSGRLQSKKIEPLKVKPKETLKEKKTTKKAAVATKIKPITRQDLIPPPKIRKNAKTVPVEVSSEEVSDTEQDAPPPKIRKNAKTVPVSSEEVSDTERPPDVEKLVDKMESLRQQGDCCNTPKEQVVTTKADVEIQCCLLTSAHSSPNIRAQNMTNENISSNNSTNELSPLGEHSASTQESKIRNLDQEVIGQTEERVVNINGVIGENSQSHSSTLNPDLSLLNSGGTFSVMKEKAEKPASSFGQFGGFRFGGYDGHLPEQNGKISNLDGQTTTRREIERLMNVGEQIFECSQSHPLTLALDVEMESRNADVMGEQIENPSNSFNNSRELNERLSNPPEERSRNFNLQSFMQNETIENVLNTDDHIDRNNQSHSLTLSQDLEFDPGIDNEPMETGGNPNNCFRESAEQFSNPSKQSERNLDEQMNVTNTTEEVLMIIEEPIEDQQNNFQSFTIPNLPIQSGVAIEIVEENENSSKLIRQWNGFATGELRNEISSDDQTDPNIKTELDTDDQIETGSHSQSTESYQSLSSGSHSQSTESYQSLSSTLSSVGEEMTSKEKQGSVSSLNEPKTLTEQMSDLPDGGSTYLINEQVSTHHKIEQSSMNIYDDQTNDSQTHFKISAQNLTLADVVENVMKENIQDSSSKKLNEHVEQLPKSTENINRDSDQQVNNEFQESSLSFKPQQTPHSEPMALLPYEPSGFLSTLRENATSGASNEQFSNSADEDRIINEVGLSLLELVSLSLSQDESPTDVTYSPEQIQAIESQIRSVRCIYIQESDRTPEEEQGNAFSSAEEDTVPVNYIRTSRSLLLEGLPKWLNYLYNLFHRKK